MSSMSTNDRWEGWVGFDSEAARGNMVWAEFEPKPWEETDIDIRVTHSSVCGSDVHMLRNGWVSHSLHLPHASVQPLRKPLTDRCMIREAPNIPSLSVTS